MDAPCILQCAEHVTVFICMLGALKYGQRWKMLSRACSQYHKMAPTRMFADANTYRSRAFILTPKMTVWSMLGITYIGCYEQTRIYMQMIVSKNGCSVHTSMRRACHSYDLHARRIEVFTEMERAVPSMLTIP